MTSSKNTFKKIGRILLAIFVVYILYVIVILIYGTITDYKPAEKITVAQEKPLSTKPYSLSQKETFKLLTWNVGYFGLGADSDFFYDADGFFTNAGKMVKSPRHLVEKYKDGIIDFMSKKAEEYDFFLLQEVDSSSSRNYYLNEVELLAKTMQNYFISFAPNYKANFVPIPLLTVWNTIGKVYSGVMTLSKYESTENTRYQFPGEFAWPLRNFNLDRCMLVSRIPLQNGKDFVVINTHLSAYDQGGVLKKQEMQYLKNYVESEYNKGNYIIVGADWNQCPPNIKSEMFFPDNLSHNPGNIPADFLAKDWTWAYDISKPTNRKLTDIYEPGKTFSNLIDFFLVSPNIEIIAVETIDLGFKYSDHQPVSIEIKLKNLLNPTIENIEQ